ncbi:MAG TPA: DUF6768 family protein, partial [Pseudomonadales bacterium]|nr:DUF6768 family protein [Pseudomonadales bacterium]
SKGEEMVSIDERIKQELEQQDGVLDELFPETAMAELLNSIRKSRVAVIFVIVFGALLFCTVIWCIVELVAAENVLDAVKWGVWVLLAFSFSAFVELWVWVQIDRIATRGEMRQMETNIMKALEKSQHLPGG